MQEQAIQLHSNLTYSKGYVMLYKNLSVLAPTINMRDTDFIPKKEFHISIIATKKYAPILMEKYKLSEEEAINKLVSEVDNFVAHTPINFDSYADEVRIVKRDDRASLIILVRIKNIDKLYNHLRATFGIDFENQPTHITLYTLENGLGIGLNGQKEFDLLSSKLSEEEARLVVSSINV